MNIKKRTFVVLYELETFYNSIEKKTLNFLVFVLLRYRGSRILQRLLQNTVTWALCCFQILISFLPFSLFFPQSMEIR